MDLTREFTDDIAPRYWYVYSVIILFFVVVLGRLIFLQLIEGSHYRLFAQAHTIKTTRIPAARGAILDRNGIPLVHNRLAHDLVVTPQELGDVERVADSVATLLVLPREIVRERLDQRKGVAPYQPFVIVEDIPYEAIAQVRAVQTPWPAADDPYDLRGVSILDRTARSYTDGSVAPHVLGYLRELSPTELAAREATQPGRFIAGDQIGATGLEAIWDARLRGRDGYIERLVDARGREVTLPDLHVALEHQAPTAGEALRISIDARLQRVAAKAFAGKVGALVAIAPTTGEILALYSAPAFDLQQLGGRDRSTYWQSILTNPDKPLLNRALQSAYPPGSTYKIVTAAAGLGEGVIHPSDQIHCGGALVFGGRNFGCWRHGGHGSTNLRRALAESCDVFFYTVGLRVGPDLLARYARQFGLGAVTGIDLPTEKPGLIPTTEWKQHARGAPWQAGETLSIAIGQGYDNVTPLQAAVMVATVAVDGRPVHPHLVASQRSGEASPPVRPDVIAPIRDGLEQVVASPSGTAHSLAPLQLKIAGKTGTAQVISLVKGKGHGALADHAWFVAYAPADDPTIAVAVLVEHGGHGGAVAAPIAGEVIRTYLK